MKWSISRLKDFENCPKRFYLTRITKEVTQTVTEALTWGRTVHEALEARIKEGAELPEGLAHIEKTLRAMEEAYGTLHAELPVAVDSAFAPCGWEDDDCMLRGKIDLLAFNEAEAIIIDYKTGRRWLDLDQLKVYATILIHAGAQRALGLYLWLRDKRVDHIKIEREDAHIIRRMITKRIEDAEHKIARSEFPARAGALCAYCPALSICKEGQRRLKK